MRPFNDGRLYLNSSGRLEHVREIDDGHEYTDYWTSGEGIELNILGKWVRGRIEHDHTGYYFICSETDSTMSNLVGVLARRPGRGAR